MANKTADIVDVIDFNYEIMLNESTTSDPKNVKVQGLLQRANAKNQNGRIYPKPILERELDNFQKKIDARNAMGELDHPDCVRGSAKILTKRGWISVQDIREDEVVYTLNTDTGAPEYQQITKKVNEPYDGKMIRIKGRNINTLVTPNHRFYLVDRYGEGYFATAQDIHDTNEYEDTYVPGGKESKAIHIDELTVEEVHDYDDNVYCVSVPNETIYLMDQGRAFWSGNSSTINLKNVSHIITKTWWEGNDVMGEIKTLNTPNGRILKNLILDNVNIGISSRGMGSVHEQMDGTLKVGDDLDLITWDVVSNPSTHGAYMDKRINENKVLSESNHYLNRHNRISRTEETSRFLSEIISEMSDSYRF